MTECTALPFTAAERRVARDFKRFGVTLQKIRPDERPTETLFTLGITQHLRKGAAVLVASDDWNVVLLALLGAKETGIHASGRRMP
ncbi:hypothetical protein [Elstera sp.]|jgi:hypothetical protein|uniref:hypothetical protein n=1 Tax=Elstera sp. TaxID=1916664 RepID=UPI0037BF984E